MRDRLPEVRPPLSEVVVDVVRRHARLCREALQPGQAGGHLFGLFDQRLGAIERQIVDDVNQQ